MAISVNTVWEMQTGGADTNGGGFVTGASGTDYSQQGAKNTVGSDISTSDGVANGTTTFTSATANFSTAIVGNIIYINGAWYQVTARASTTSVTIDRTIGAASGLTLNIGGALLTPGQLFTNLALGHIAYVKSGTYTLTSTVTITTNFAGTSATAQNLCSVNGYGATRGDNGTRPLITTSTNSVSLFTLNGADGILWNNISFSNTATTRLRGFQVSGASYHQTFVGCIFDGFTIAFNGNWNVNDTCRQLVFIGCEIKNCTDTTAAVQNTNGQVMLYCYVHGNTGAGSSRPGNSSFIGAEIYRYTVFASNGAGGINIPNGGAVTASYIVDVDHCVFYTNTGSGIKQGDGTIVLLMQNNIFDSNTRYGWEISTSNSNDPPYCALNQYNAYYNNTLGLRLNGAAGTGDVTLTGSPFTNAGSADFSLNSTTGAGTACKGAGFPGVTAFIGTGGADIGSIQTVAAGGGTTELIIQKTVRNIVRR